MSRPAKRIGWYAVWAVLTSGVLATVVAVRAQDQDWTARYERLLAEEARSRGESTRDRADAVGGRFDALFPVMPTDGTASMAPADAEFGFRAANLTHFYTQDEKHLEQMRFYFEQLASKERLQRHHIKDMAGAYIAARRWSDAEQVAARFPEQPLPAVPVMDDRTSLAQGVRSTVLQIGPDLGSLPRVALPLASGPAIVVISHPLCQFTRHAVAAIEADPALSALMKHAYWVAPVDRQLQLEVLQRWNAQHPASTMTLAYARSEWPQFDDWGTPTFYFLMNGQLKAKIEGWPETGHRDQLLAAAHTIGLQSEH